MKNQADRIEMDILFFYSFVTCHLSLKLNSWHEKQWISPETLSKDSDCFWNTTHKCPSCRCLAGLELKVITHIGDVSESAGIRSLVFSYTRPANEVFQSGSPLTLRHAHQISSVCERACLCDCLSCHHFNVLIKAAGFLLGDPWSLPADAISIQWGGSCSWSRI